MKKSKNTDLRSELTNLILKAEWHMSNQLSEFLKQNGGNITPTAWQVLETLSDTRGMTMSTLCSATRLNDSTLTKVVDKLVNSSLAYRRADASDRRKVLVHRSKRGASLYDKLRGPIEDSYKGAFPGCSDEQAIQLINQLKSIMVVETS